MNLANNILNLTNNLVCESCCSNFAKVAATTLRKLTSPPPGQALYNAADSSYGGSIRYLNLANNAMGNRAAASLAAYISQP